MNINNQHPHQGQSVLHAGKPITDATCGMILLHGRGASAYDIISLGEYLHHPEMIYLAPQALYSTWYPYSFMAPVESNEPFLSSALAVVAELAEKIVQAGIPTDRLIIAGFSQGACLASEFVGRNPTRYGGLLAFSGGLIGPPGGLSDYPGTLGNTPIFLGCSNVDPHIPLKRVQETSRKFREMGADVNEIIYPGMAHTVIENELIQGMNIVGAIPPLKSLDE